MCAISKWMASRNHSVRVSSIDLKNQSPSEIYKLTTQIYTYNGTGPLSAAGILNWAYFSTVPNATEPNYSIALEVGNLLSDQSTGTQVCP
jgi:hypothetical protein